MNYLEFALFSAIIFPLFSNTDGADECRTQRLLCYDCDSRYDPYCGDPFNRSLPQELRPPAKVCHGCCVKFVHKFPDSEWVQRSCTENIIINYFMVDHVCMNEGKGHGQMCFCEHNLCNGGPSTVQLSTSPLLNYNLLLSLSVSVVISNLLTSVYHRHFSEVI